MNYFQDNARNILCSTHDNNNSLRTRKIQNRILVTGGAGFLGSYLCELLLGAGHEVVCVDNFSTGLRRNIARLKRFDTFRVIAHDIGHLKYLESQTHRRHI